MPWAYWQQWVLPSKECLEAPSERLTKKQGKGDKSNAAEALSDDEVNILYEKYLH